VLRYLALRNVPVSCSSICNNPSDSRRSRTGGSAHGAQGSQTRVRRSVTIRVLVEPPAVSVTDEKDDTQEVSVGHFRLVPRATSEIALLDHG
jgi:hypothetical protein